MIISVEVEVFVGGYEALAVGFGHYISFVNYVSKFSKN